MSTYMCPEFRPTLEEFSNFARYVETIEPVLREVGLVKARGGGGRALQPRTSVVGWDGAPPLPSPRAQVIPPAGWVSGLPYDVERAATDAPLPDTVFPKVRMISQAVMGKGGVFELAIRERRAPISAEDFRKLARASESTALACCVFLRFCACVCCVSVSFCVPV